MIPGSTSMCLLHGHAAMLSVKDKRHPVPFDSHGPEAAGNSHSWVFWETFGSSHRSCMQIDTVRPQTLAVKSSNIEFFRLHGLHFLALVLAVAVGLLRVITNSLTVLNVRVPTPGEMPIQLSDVMNHDSKS